MKRMIPIFILFIVGVLFSLSIYPISRTSWADGIRDQVRKARAARRAKVEPQKDLPQIQSEEKTGDPVAISKVDPNIQKETRSVKGPVPKPPQFSVAGIIQGLHFLAEISILFLCTAFILKISEQLFKKKRRE